MGKQAYKYRIPVTLLLLGVFFMGIGTFLFIGGGDSVFSKSGVEIIKNEASKVIVEISGAVKNPGVYVFSSDSRVEDVLLAADGFATDADYDWIEKTLNRAAYLDDGAKIYIPRASEMDTGSFLASNSGQININKASSSELESLPGIGPVYAQNIIEHRPYSTVDDLLKTGALKSHVYEQVKELVTAY